MPKSDHAALNKIKKKFKLSNQEKNSKSACSKYNVTFKILQISKVLKTNYLHVQQFKWFWIL